MENVSSDLSLDHDTEVVCLDISSAWDVPSAQLDEVIILRSAVSAGIDRETVPLFVDVSHHGHTVIYHWHLVSHKISLEGTKSKNDGSHLQGIDT